MVRGPLPGNKTFREVFKSCELIADLHFLSGFGAGEEVRARAAELAGLVPMLDMCNAAVQIMSMRYTRLHKATGKLGSVMLGLLAGVVREGFCTAETGEDASEDGGNGQWQEAEGTVSTSKVPSVQERVHA